MWLVRHEVPEDRQDVFARLDTAIAAQSAAGAYAATRGRPEAVARRRQSIR